MLKFDEYWPRAMNSRDENGRLSISATSMVSRGDSERVFSAMTASRYSCVGQGGLSLTFVIVTMTVAFPVRPPLSVAITVNEY